MLWGQVQLARMALWRLVFLLFCRRGMTKTVGSTGLSANVEGCFKLEKDHAQRKVASQTDWVVGKKLTQQRSQDPGSKPFTEHLL